MKNICLLWDFDNTLAYRDGMWTKSLSNVLNNNGYYDFDKDIISTTLQKGYPWSRHEEAHKDYFGEHSWWEYINSLIIGALNAIGMTDSDENEKIAKQFKDEYLRYDAWYLYDETLRNLDYSVQNGYSNIILSNHVPELSNLVESLGITKYFKTQITSALVGYDKPHPNIFNEAKKYGTYDKYYMIGDNYEADVLGAKAAGFEAIMVRKENIAEYERYAQTLDGIWEYIE